MAKPIPVQVSLDINANPPVTTIPDPLAVGKGNNIIEWVPNEGSPYQPFTFVWLSGLPGPPAFLKLNVTDSQITVHDDNSAIAHYPYAIIVSYQGEYYSTDSTATESKAKHPKVPNSPTIKNN